MHRSNAHGMVLPSRGVTSRLNRHVTIATGMAREVIRLQRLVLRPHRSKAKSGKTTSALVDLVQCFTFNASDLDVRRSIFINSHSLTTRGARDQSRPQRSPA